MKKVVFFLEENVNKNTKTKTKCDMKVITDFFTSIGEERAPGQIPPKTLTVLSQCMARFFLGVLKKDGTEYEQVCSCCFELIYIAQVRFLLKCD